VGNLLCGHSAEVEAIARALLERGDLAGKECLEIIERVARGGEGWEAAGQEAPALSESIQAPLAVDAADR